MVIARQTGQFIHFPTTLNASEPDSLKPFQAGLFFSFFNSTNWMVVLGTPAVLLIETLGAGPFQVGLLYSFVFLLLPIQVLATATLPRFGYKKQVIFAWSARAVFVLVPAAIAFRAPVGERPDLVNAMLAAMFLFCFFRSIGTSGVQPWLFDLIPENLHARYFSTDMAVINVGGVITLIFCSLTFTWFEPFTAFSVQYGYAILGAALSVVGLSRLPAVPHPENFGALRILKEGPKLLTRPGHFRHYMILSTIWIVSGSAVVPFSIYYLKAEAGLSQASIVLFSAIQSVGGIAGALIMKSRIDRIGIQRSFLIVLGLNLAVYAGWTFFIVLTMRNPELTRMMIFLLPVNYVLLGASGATYFGSHWKYLAFVTENRERALKVSLHTAVVGLITGFASILWGLLFKQSGAVAAMNLHAFVAYFVCNMLIQLALIPVIRHLKEPDPGIKPITARYAMLRLRFLTILPDLRRRNQDESES